MTSATDKFEPAGGSEAGAVADREVHRREILRLMGASLALAGASGCSPEPAEYIVPYVSAPREAVAPYRLNFASAWPQGGYALGVVVESHLGRPIKIEGNPKHPASLGKTSVQAQAAVLELYDPDRSQTVRAKTRISTWPALLASLRGSLERLGAGDGRGLHVLTETVASPTLADQLRSLAERFPQMRWHQYEPLHRDELRAGARLAFGRDVDTYYRLDQAEILLALDADFLADRRAGVRYAYDFAERRKVREGRAGMNRLWVAEATPSLTGAMADHRLPLAASRIQNLAAAVAARLGLDAKPESDWTPSEYEALWIDTVAEDLDSHRGASVVIPGEGQPATVHALAHAINRRLENEGKTVVHTEPVEPYSPDRVTSLRELARALQNDEVELLIILGGNPVWTAPADIALGDLLPRAKLSVHLSLFYDETSARSDWHLPASHPLEMWSDAKAYEGTASIIQPLIAPLYDSKSPHELLATLLGEPQTDPREAVRRYWRAWFLEKNPELKNGENGEGANPGAEEREGQGQADEAFERFWRAILNTGVIPETEAVPITPELTWNFRTPNGARPKDTAAGETIELVFRPDGNIEDGRFANNAWLQELPRPITLIVWANAALVSPTLAEHLGVDTDDVIEISLAGRSIELPAYVQPGQAEETVTVHLGYGRERAGRVGNQVGVNAYELRASPGFWFARGARVRKTGRKARLVSPQPHDRMEYSDPVRVADLSTFRENPSFAFDKPHYPGEKPPPKDLPSLYPEPVPPLYEEDTGPSPYAWGMVIDLTTCIGCHACTIACQAENNIPVVGEEQVWMGREMHWIRVDRYYAEEKDQPEYLFQPRPCMHCENAPCEVVCPTEATVHSHEGLNLMIYNRCIGTRYCSNNCPYKVRRFNFLEFANFDSATLKLRQNPDVTVRSRGVMEKCTYCVQRISEARIQAKKENRLIRDGEVVTACQQVCPAQAITFGNLADPESAVSNAAKQPQDYALLRELNTRPRTTYLARITNPHPKLAQKE